MPAFQASIVGLRYPGLAAWAMRFRPFGPSTIRSKARRAEIS